MKKSISIFKHITTLFWGLVFVSALQAQQVWPGDVNNNGIVNEVDLLFWGLAHGSSGRARADEGTDWQAYDLPPLWPQNFANGVNFAYADCNGDGLVDETDFDDAIEANFGLQHQTPTPEAYANAAAGSNAPKLRLQPSQPAVEEGAMVDITLSIEDALMPIDSFYGIALSLSYTTGLLEGDDGPDFDLESDNWIEFDNSYVEYLFHESGSQGTAALAVTRTNQLAAPVQEGTFGVFSIVIEDIIVGLHIDTFYLQIDSVLLITPDFNTIPVVPDTAQIIVAKDLNLLTSSHEAPADAVRVYPSPARNVVFVQADFPLTEPELIDQLGRVIPVALHKTGPHDYRLNCTGLAPGLYGLRTKSSKGVIFKKIIITH